MSHRIIILIALLALRTLPRLWAGSGVGLDCGIERTSYLDPVTGVRVWELTSGRADNLYLHN